jgi:8-amino-7-oxononanoate synthase
MDGDCPNLEELVRISEHHCRLVVDEACIGCFWLKRRRIRSNVGFARPYFCPYFDFRKWFRMSRAAILGSVELRDCLEFAQSLIYHRTFLGSVAAILTGYQHLEKRTNHSATRKNIIHFNQEKNMLGLKQLFVHSKSAIQSAIIP